MSHLCTTYLPVSGNLADAHTHIHRPPFPTNTMPTSPSPSPSRDFDTNELRSLIAQDLAASNELAARITQLRQDIEDGKSLPPKKVALMEQSNKDMTKDLVARVEKIERAANLDAADREMLQVLNVRLAVCDLQTMRLAELRDLELIARGTKKKVFLDAKAGPSATVEPEEELSPGHGPVRKTEEDEDFVFVSQEEDAESSFDGSNLDEEKAGSEYSDEPQIDKSGWPLLYRIMNVDPDTMAMDMERLLKA